MEKERNDEMFFDEAVDLIELQFTDLFGQCKMVEMRITFMSLYRYLKDRRTLLWFVVM